jgi:hypothetical protein
MLSNIFLLLLLSVRLQENDSFSWSRILLSFPKNQDVSSFFSSVSSAIRDSPKNIIDFTSLNGLDGSLFQQGGGGGGGGIRSMDVLRGGKDGWKKALLLLPSLKNDTTSSLTDYFDNVECNSFGRGYQSMEKDKKKRKDRLNLLRAWWERNTSGSKGLLIYLFPAICSQIAILSTAVPFFLDRLSQYLQPIYIGLSFLMLQKRGPGIIQATLWTSVLIGKWLSSVSLRLTSSA